MIQSVLFQGAPTSGDGSSWLTLARLAPGRLVPQAGSPQLDGGGSGHSPGDGQGFPRQPHPQGMKPATIASLRQKTHTLQRTLCGGLLHGAGGSSF